MTIEEFIEARLAAIWSDHPDYQERWKLDSEDQP